jgi:hypothetical protein
MGSASHGDSRKSLAEIGEDTTLLEMAQSLSKKFQRVLNPTPRFQQSPSVLRIRPGVSKGGMTPSEMFCLIGKCGAVVWPPSGLFWKTGPSFANSAALFWTLPDDLRLAPAVPGIPGQAFGFVPSASNGIHVASRQNQIDENGPQPGANSVIPAPRGCGRSPGSYLVEAVGARLPLARRSAQSWSDHGKNMGLRQM